jgi:hypothetical protein
MARFCSTESTDFVHPDDRPATVAVAIPEIDGLCPCGEPLDFEERSGHQLGLALTERLGPGRIDELE